MEYELMSNPFIEENRMLIFENKLIVKDKYIFCYDLEIHKMLESLKEYFVKAFTEFEIKFLSTKEKE